MSGPTPAATEVATSSLEGSGAPFSRTTLWVIAGLVLVSLVAIIVLTLHAEDLEAEPSNGADGYSASAIGHRGLIKLLRNLDIPVVVSQSESAAKAKTGLLVIAEPVVTDELSAERFRKMVRSANRVLVILPKWWTTTSSDRKEWAEYVDLVPLSDVQAVLAELDLGSAQLQRADAGTTPISTAPGDPPSVTIAHAPQTLHDAYLTDSYDLDGEDRVVLGTTSIGDTTITVLVDPDIINNHGLDEGLNARFAVGLIDRLREGGPVVFDEIAHGYTLEPSIWKLMFQWPLVLATLQALICMVIIVLATVGRFGPPAASPRAISAGKDFLIRNTAALLRYGGHDGEALRRYLTSAVHHVRATVHTPRDLGGANLIAWLERIRIARKGTIALPDLDREVNAAATDPALAKKIPEIAMRIHRWRQEMTHGSGNHQ